MVTHLETVTNKYYNGKIERLESLPLVDTAVVPRGPGGRQCLSTTR